MALTDRMTGLPTDIVCHVVEVHAVGTRLDEGMLTERLNELHADPRVRRLVCVVPVPSGVGMRFLIYVERFKGEPSDPRSATHYHAEPVDG